MKLFKIFSYLLTLTIFTISCAAPLNIAEIENNLKTKGGYDSYLSLEYFEFSRSLKAAKDEKKSKFFLQKALAIADGNKVVPENPLTWEADPAQVEEMILSQKRMEKVLFTPQMKFYLPIQLAHLSYLYDCWISRESQAIFRADELAQCRTRFHKLLSEIENYLDDLRKEKTPKVVIKEPEFERFEIFFDFNSFKFNDKANKDMIKILQYLADLKGNYRILLVGNADRVGPELSNDHLALNRAENVKNYLIKNAVAESLIEMRSVGEDFPDILTKDGSQQQQNRVVGIYVLKGAGNFSSFPLPLLENKIYRQEIQKALKARVLQ